MINNINYKHLLTVVIVYLIVDLPWLMYFSKKLDLSWSKAVEDIQNKPIKPRYSAGIISYILIACIIYYFCILNKENEKFKDIMMDCLVISLAIYGSFDLINYTIFSDLKLKYVISDILWGFISISLTVSISKYIISLYS